MKFLRHFLSRLNEQIKLFEESSLLSVRGIIILYFITGLFFAAQSTWTSTDSLMTSLLVPNIAQGHGLDLSKVRQVQEMTDPDGCFFRYAPSGYYLSIYPIGMFILSLPLQLTLWFGAWFLGAPVDVTSLGVFHTRFEIEKATASFIAALTVFGLHRCLFQIVSRAASRFTVLLFIAGSSCLSMLCQGLWQHTGINLLLIWMVAYLLSDREKPTFGAKWTFFFCCGFLVAIRPTAIVFSIALGLAWFILFSKDRSILSIVGELRSPVFAAIVGVSPAIFWNYFVWGNALGGYGIVLQKVIDFNPRIIATRLGSILFSPYRGFIFYNPLCLLSFFSFKWSRSFDRRLSVVFLAIVSSCGIHLVLCATNPTWHGGLSFGPRYMLDTLALLFILMGIGLDAVLSIRLYRLISQGIVALLSVYSFSIHFIGAKGATIPWYWMQELNHRICAWFTTLP
jgi:hypothetical protein